MLETKRWNDFFYDMHLLTLILTVISVKTPTKSFGSLDACYYWMEEEDPLEN